MFLNKKLRPCHSLWKQENSGSGFQIQSFIIKFYLFQGRNAYDRPQWWNKSIYSLKDSRSTSISKLNSWTLRFASTFNSNQKLTVLCICEVVWHLLIYIDSSNVISWYLNRQPYYLNSTVMWSTIYIIICMCLYCHLLVLALGKFSFHLWKAVKRVSWITDGFSKLSI